MIANVTFEWTDVVVGVHVTSVFVQVVINAIAKPTVVTTIRVRCSLVRSFVEHCVKYLIRTKKVNE